MRAKRSKKYRKIMISYEQTFGFRPPFQVLLDSAFIHACHVFKMPLQKSLENTLHDPSRLFITKCTLAKIMDEEKARRKSVGENEHHHGGRPDWLPPPTEVPLRYCKHNDEESTVEEWRCLVDLVAGNPRGNEQAKNKSHFVLATAEASEAEQKTRGFVDTRERARQVPGVPIVYVKRSVMVLEEFSGASESRRRGVEKEKFREGLIGGAGDRKRKRGEAEDEVEVEKMLEERQRKTKVKGPKQPNPLSVPKKKVPEAKEERRTVSEKPADDEANQDEPTEGATVPTKGKRKRRHGKRKDIDTFKEALLEADGEPTSNGVMEAHSRLQEAVI